MKLDLCQQIFEKYSATAFHENPSSGSRVPPYGQTDGQANMTKLIVAFRNFTKQTIPLQTDSSTSNRQFHFKQTIPLQTDNSTSNRQFHFKQTVPLQTDSSASNRQFHFKHTIPLQTDNSTSNIQFHFKQTIPLQTDNSASNRQFRFKHTIPLQTDNSTSNRQFHFKHTGVSLCYIEKNPEEIRCDKPAFNWFRQVK